MNPVMTADDHRLDSTPRLFGLLFTIDNKAPPVQAFRIGEKSIHDFNDLNDPEASHLAARSMDQTSRRLSAGAIERARTPPATAATSATSSAKAAAVTMSPASRRQT